MPDGVPTFSQHNIVLPDGSETCPGGTLIAEVEDLRAAFRTLDLLIAKDDRAKIRVVDLGCLEGGYAVEFARAGYDTLGVDIRRHNIDRAAYVADVLGLPNLRFAHGDARNFASEHGTFDVVWCCGLLYHLADPRAFLRVLGSGTRRVLFLHTHYADGRRTPDRKTYPPQSFSHTTWNEGMRGRWYLEFFRNRWGFFDPRWRWQSSAVSQNEETAHSSWGSLRSFWLEKPELLQAIREAGFPVVYEQFDGYGVTVADYDRWIYRRNRSMFVGIKPCLAAGFPHRDV